MKFLRSLVIIYCSTISSTLNNSPHLPLASVLLPSGLKGARDKEPGHFLCLIDLFCSSSRDSGLFSCVCVFVLFLSSRTSPALLPQRSTKNICPLSFPSPRLFQLCSGLSVDSAPIPWHTTSLFLLSSPWSFMQTCWAGPTKTLLGSASDLGLILFLGNWRFFAPTNCHCRSVTVQ